MTSPNKALISGVTGFVGAWTAYTFLKHGWSVRGTVRSQAKADALASQPAFKDFVSSGQFEFVIVEDVATGDFSSALKGIDHFIHTASPFSTSGTDNKKDFLDPAIKGTENAITAAHKAGVKHFGVTSSFAAIMDVKDMASGFPFTGKKYTDEDWGTTTYDEAAASETPVVGYVVSKLLAEKTAWEFQKKHNLQDTMKVSTICPPMIYGPFLHTNKSSALGESEGTIRDIITNKSGSDEIPPPSFPLYADVRDVAETHFQACAQNVQGRFAVCGGPYDNQMVVDFAHKHFPEQAKKYKVPTGTPGKYITENDKLVSLDNSKTKKILGIKYPHSAEQTFKDTFADIYAHL
ncbi:unnamed protein product [Sympodiomycopsis kandeliae]